MVCYNPLVAAERRCKRDTLMERTEADAEVLAAEYADSTTYMPCIHNCPLWINFV